MLQSLMPRKLLRSAGLALLALLLVAVVLAAVIVIRFRPHFRCITFEGYEDLGRLSSAQLHSLETRIAGIRASCGQVCRTDPADEANLTTVDGGSTFRKEVQCRELFLNEDIDKPAEIAFPPYEIPDSLFSAFSYSGRVPVRRSYFGESPENGHTLFWSESFVEGLRRPGASTTYGYGAGDKIRRQMGEGGAFRVQGKRVLVIGTQYPWVEAMLLENGASHVTTLDYVQIYSTHPKVSTVVPADLSRGFLEGKVEPFDAVISFSSIEHSGLGRYGDDLNPWGDLITMSRAWCLLRPGGRALIGVPAGRDRLLFNANRRYGKVMLPHLFANFKLIYQEVEMEDLFRVEDELQPIFVMRKVE